MPPRTRRRRSLKSTSWACDEVGREATAAAASLSFVQTPPATPATLDMSDQGDVERLYM
jgi:hypothetical protein